LQLLADASREDAGLPFVLSREQRQIAVPRKATVALEMSGPRGEYTLWE
jgi:hypothetical protein